MTGGAGDKVAGGFEHHKAMSDWTTGRLLSTAARLCERDLAHRLRKPGLTSSDFTFLQTLEQIGASSLTNVAHIIHITPQSVGRTAVRLERLGFIERRKLPPGRRGITVSLSAAGRHALLQASNVDPLRDVLDETVLAELRDDLIKVLTAHHLAL
ncbi:MarR family winged helix-turn-helix transcriptional regulator [Arthrobacter agilis]|uniref:MarR family winged helix-turn-helix transcriptional regulator n=1 Tax=Arthrobacter agilis TaxID=37921 RepID=UPI002782BF75|nr:MarR family transcriptional regulator [Arthrobacter agilis]MDQ0734723.1 DNA-binding MarR family transcriptional regulator [Arthrobacter agilis]